MNIAQMLEEYELNHYGNDCPNPWAKDPDGGHMRVVMALSNVIDICNLADFEDRTPSTSEFREAIKEEFYRVYPE